jgi:hypothetical protein
MPRAPSVGVEDEGSRGELSETSKERHREFTQQRRFVAIEALHSARCEMHGKKRLNPPAAIWALQRALKVRQSVEEAILEEATHKSPESATAALRLLDQMSRLDELETLLGFALEEMESMQQDLDHLHELATRVSSSAEAVIPFPRKGSPSPEQSTDDGGAGARQRAPRAA